jgi:RND family efflux transporter MFP subunit
MRFPKFNKGTPVLPLPALLSPSMPPPATLTATHPGPRLQGGHSAHRRRESARMLSLSSRPLPTLAAACLLLAGLAACGPRGEAPAAGTAASGPGGAASAPPVSVSTVRAQQRDMAVLINATGTVAPLSTVDVRPQTTNLVAQVHVKEGQFVKAGQLLFTLDARADEANLARARAQLARSEAALADAQRQLQRSQELLAQNFIAQGALDTNQTNVQSLTAALAADKAALDAARLALSYTRITASSAGRLGAISVFPGSSVQANQTTLASITRLDPISVAFSLPQRHLADALAALKDGGAAVIATPPASEGQPPAGPAPRDGARAAAADGSGNGAAKAMAAHAPAAGTRAGRLSFVDNAVDASSGSVKVKAQFDNRDGLLWPGAFVNVAMTARVLRGAVVVPQAAIVQSARGPLVYIVVDGMAQLRPVQVLYAQGDEAAVSGVEPGARVVLDGRQNLRPGAAVLERAADAAPAGGRGGKGGAAGAASAAASAAAPALTGKGATP